MDAFFPLISIFIWSGNMLVNKMAAGVISPLAISFYRWALAGLILTPICWRLIVRHGPQVKAQFWRLFILGAFGMVLYPSSAYFAAHTITATKSGVMQGLLPVYTLLLGRLVFRNKLSAFAVLGSIISLIGVMIFICKGSPLQLFHEHLQVGDAWMGFAVLSYSIYSLLLKHWEKKIQLPVWVSLNVQVLSAVTILTPFYLLNGDFQIHSSSFGLIAYAGVLASLGAPYFWMRGIAVLGAPRASVFMNLMPVVSAILAYFILAERMVAIQIVAAAMIIIGVALTQMTSGVAVRLRQKA
ncbi:EamA family transporter [Vibrio sp. S4M6]|uniref:DMT family transporter n=1 Tax=Vibrio sinus TaxID=2946865 RepID=UPI00202AA6C8|nr:EamA family transporter [Vibrio sinus]MCL9782079.1 EamA family transporter [Vibrio sinus]